MRPHWEHLVLFDGYLFSGFALLVQLVAVDGRKDMLLIVSELVKWCNGRRVLSWTIALHDR